jgi:hypothetical protein
VHTTTSTRPEDVATCECPDGTSCVAFTDAAAGDAYPLYLLPPGTPLPNLLRSPRFVLRPERARKLEAKLAAAAAGIVSFDGNPATGFLPPDTTGDIGPNHFVQAVNATFGVFDRQGNRLAGPSNINSLWATFGGNCQTHNSGDPDVRYDALADRWVIMQFTLTANPMTSATDFCIAVSRTADPVTGGWFLYDFPTGGVSNDYPKLAVWPDAYYLGSQRGSSDAWAVDRANMLVGAAATMQGFNDAGRFMLPSDLDGPTPPPAGAPNIFARIVDGAELGGVDRIELRAFHVDFGTPASSTFTVLPDLPAAAFDRNLCDLTLKAMCIPQPGTSVLLEALTRWPLARLQYRNFGSRETLVFNHAVDADGADHAGLRWYELRRTGGIGGAWSIFQQATHAPDLGAPGLADDVNRWFGSAAMDRLGNIALGYSVGNGSVFPGLSWAGRLAGDPLNTTPQAETVIVAGGGSQTHASARWGDYAALLVDPVDDCTFWFTSEYMPSTSAAGWRTRIASFRLAGCNAAPVCDADGPYVAECAGATTNVALDGSASSDPNADPLALPDRCLVGGTATGPMPSVQFPGPAMSTINLAVSDGALTTTCSSSVNIQDTTPPTIPSDTTIECTSPAGSSAPFGMPTDICDPMVLASNDAPAILPFGSTTVTWTAMDHSGNTATGTQIVTVVDTTPPVLTVSLTPDVLWPPNHTLRNIHANIAVSDACDSAPVVRLVSITSSEPDSGTGPHDVPHDIQNATFGSDDRFFRLRAEHSPGGIREYVVTYVAEDAHGNITTAQATVRVPKSGATLISRDGLPADGPSRAVAINVDGSVVAFSSDAANLVPHDSNQLRDVFVRNRPPLLTERVSVSDAEGQANGASGAPAISATGQFVAFSSTARNLVSGDTNGRSDVFVRDRVAGATERVSVVGLNGEANGTSGLPSISGDGRFVAFQSLADNLVGADTNGTADIFVRDRLTQTTERLCDAMQANSFSTTPAISADGRVVAFASAATNLVAGDTNRRIDIFTCDRDTGLLERSSVNSSGEEADGSSFLPAISEDGRYAFKSLADNLVPNDFNGLVDVFVRDRFTGITERISVNRRGGDADDVVSAQHQLRRPLRGIRISRHQFVSPDTNDV